MMSFVVLTVKDLYLCLAGKFCVEHLITFEFVR